MNKLPLSRRAKILHLLVEGVSMRSISRLEGVAINTVTKLLVDAGRACEEFHNETVRGITARHVECDEIWSFCYAKQKNAEDVQGNPEHAGDVWTWTALDSDTKLILSWLVSTGRDGQYAIEFMDDLCGRLANRVQLSTDGHKAYLEAVEGAFGANVDYAQIIKIYGTGEETGTVIDTEKILVSGNPDYHSVCTSYVERHNLTTRMSVRRFTRLTNAFSKKIQNHCHALALYFVWYNFCRKHTTLSKPYPKSPAMAAGLADQIYDMEWLAALVDSRIPKPGPRGPYRPRKSTISN